MIWIHQIWVNNEKDVFGDLVCNWQVIFPTWDMSIDDIDLCPSCHPYQDINAVCAGGGGLETVSLLYPVLHVQRWSGG